MSTLVQLEKRKRVYRDSIGAPFHVTPSGRVGAVELVARAQLVHLPGNARPYFSLTGDVINPRSVARGGDGFLCGGSIHGEILHVFPELAPVAMVHLADDDGQPMHAADNAAYWAGMYQREQSFDGNRLAEHLRVTREKAQVMTEWVGKFMDMIPDMNPKEVWESCFDFFEIRETWKQHAEHALAVINGVTVNA